MLVKIVGLRPTVRLKVKLDSAMSCAGTNELQNVDAKSYAHQLSLSMICNIWRSPSSYSMWQMHYSQWRSRIFHKRHAIMMIKQCHVLWLISYEPYFIISRAIWHYIQYGSKNTSAWNQSNYEVAFWPCCSFHVAQI